jgi:hypothetical protein
MWNKREMLYRWMLQSIRFIISIMILDLPLIFLYSRFTLMKPSHVASIIMILEGAILLIVFAISSSRSLMIIFKMKGPIQDFKLQRSGSYERFPKGGSLLISAIILIILGFSLDLAINYLKVN